jgi:hypothetical protein
VRSFTNRAEAVFGKRLIKQLLRRVGSREGARRSIFSFTSVPDSREGGILLVQL